MKMDMKEWVQMWKAISEGKVGEVPAQLHLKGQMTAIVRAFGSEFEVYAYFKKVMDAEPALIKNGDVSLEPEDG